MKGRPLKDLFTICAVNKPINNAPAVPKKVQQMETFNTSQNSLAEKIFLKFSYVNSNEVKMLVLLYVALGF